MSAATIVKEVAVAVRDFQSLGKLQAYLFGSALRSGIAWTDIDILLVCEVEEDGIQARQTLAELCMTYPIDLVVMTVEEEFGFGFIRSEGCRWVAESQVRAGLEP